MRLQLIVAWKIVTPDDCYLVRRAESARAKPWAGGGLRCAATVGEI